MWSRKMFRLKRIRGWIKSLKWRINDLGERWSFCIGVRGMGSLLRFLVGSSSVEKKRGEEGDVERKQVNYAGG